MARICVWLSFIDGTFAGGTIVERPSRPFAADPHPLDEADDGQDDGAPDADLVVGGTKPTAKVARPVNSSVAINVALRPMRLP